MPAHYLKNPWSFLLKFVFFLLGFITKFELCVCVFVHVSKNKTFFTEMSQFSSLINMTHYLSKTQSSPNSFNIYILKEKPGLAGSGKFATNCSKQQLDR